MAKSRDLADSADVINFLDNLSEDVNSGLTTKLSTTSNLSDLTDADAALVNLGLTATATELNYTDGVTSAIQTQIDTKAPLASPTFTGTVTADGLVIDTDTLYIDSVNNRVGIGTSSPAVKLHVANTASTSPQSIRLENSEGYGQITTDSNLMTYDAQLHLFNNKARTTEYMRIDSSGNLLVGKTSTDNTTNGFVLDANGTLNVVRSSEYLMRLNRTTTDGEILRFQKDGASVGSIGSNATGGTPVLDISTNSTSGIMRMLTSNTERMRIDSSGNIGLGTSSPQYLGHFVNGDVAIVSTNTTNNAEKQSLLFGGASGEAAGLAGITGYRGASAGIGELIFKTNSGGGITEAMRIDSDGNLLINDTAHNNPKNKLLIVRDAVASGGVENLYWSSGTALTLESKQGVTDSAIGINFLAYHGSVANNAYINAISTTSGSSLSAALAFGRRTGVSTYSESMRIDNTGNLLVGKTAAGIVNTGVELRGNGQLFATQSGNYPLLLNRTTSDGVVIQLRRDNVTVGSIGTLGGDLRIFTETSGHSGLGFGNGYINPTNNTGANTNGATDLGFSGSKFKDAYFSGTVNANAFVGDGSSLTGVGGGGLSSMQVFTSSGTWTKPAGINYVKVIVTGGGGGGAGGDWVTQSYGGGGGAAGGTTIEWIDVSAVSSVSVTVGSGGSGGAYGSGSTGGQSSFGSYNYANGGGGGVGGSYPDGGFGGAASGGNINIRGGDGGAGTVNTNINYVKPQSGMGGSSIWGSGGFGRSGNQSINGVGAYAYGAGGSGAIYNNTTRYVGGSGAGGIVVVMEYK